MFRSCLILVGFVLAVWSMPADPELPEPIQLALILGEDDFDDYLDHWLEIQNEKWLNNVTRTEPSLRNGCTLRVNGDLGQPQPVYVARGGIMPPLGNTGTIHLNSGEEVLIGCTGPSRTIVHPNIAASTNTATATCVNGVDFSGAGWLNGNGAFGGLTCSGHSYYDAEGTSERCWNNNLVIRVGFLVNGVFHPTYWSCFDQHRLEVLYVWFEQTPANAVAQTGVDRPSWLAGGFYPGLSINNLYTQVTQKVTIAGLVGQELADKYITNVQFLTRGHLAAKSDYVYATGQRSTFYFINAAPQWQPLNSGNWNSLEQNLRLRIGVAGYHTTVYTGTWGISQLRNENDQLVDLYLHRDNNNNDQIPVPLYFYKVVYDADRREGTAFVSINNPYYTSNEVQALTFCTDRCRGNSGFNWVGWLPDRIDLGYSFCCDVDDFRRTIPHLPAFTVDGLLM